VRGIRGADHPPGGRRARGLTERVDVLRYRAVAVGFWVCGTFEVRGGRITLWRDYFGWTTFLLATARGMGRAAAGAGLGALGGGGLLPRGSGIQGG
jgi:Limonene-1,2-epoxide hydrolase catalytic domain